MTMEVENVAASLTEKETAVLGACYRSDFYSGVGRPDVWSWSVEAKGLNAHAVAGVLSSLQTKGCVRCVRDEKDDVVSVTELGHLVACFLKIYES